MFGMLFKVNASQDKIRRDIATHLNKLGTLKPYSAEKMFDVQPEFVLELLINCLNVQGAWVLCWDKKAGVICWCDTGGSFVPLPDRFDETKMHGLKQAKVTFRQCFVYGSARIVASGDGTWLAIRTLGIDAKSGRRDFSDGTYERKLINSLDRKIHKIAIGQRKSPEFHEPKNRRSRQLAVNYDELFKSKFRNFPKIGKHDITAKIQGEPFAVTTDKLWKACMDVVTQYALIPYVQSDEKVFVFSRKLPVPVSVDTKKVKHVNVIIAVTIQPDEKDAENSSKMYVSLLGEYDLIPRKVEIKSSENQKESEVDLSGPLIETAAAMSINELMKDIDIQLYYNEILGTKLLRRFNE